MRNGKVFQFGWKWFIETIRDLKIECSRLTGWIIESGFEGLLRKIEIKDEGKMRKKWSESLKISSELLIF
jgi:hypothetical protein